MDASMTRGLVNQVLYGIDRVRDLGDETMVARCADSIIDQRHFRRPVGEYAEAIGSTLRAGRLPVPASELSRRYDEEELLGFLARLAQRLDALRPWPRPAFRRLDVAEWDGFVDATLIARIERPMHQITGVLNRSFDSVPLGDRKLPVLILELRTGDVVALMGSVEPATTHAVLLQRDPGDPAETIGRFVECTGFAPGDVIPVAQ